MTEAGDFSRFKNAQKFASYTGLISRAEQSSGESVHKTKITKAGNSYLRRLAVECAWAYIRGYIGQKSVELKKRQKDIPSDVIKYADKASARCHIDSLKTVKSLIRL